MTVALKWEILHLMAAYSIHVIIYTPLVFVMKNTISTIEEQNGVASCEGDNNDLPHEITIITILP